MSEIIVRRLSIDLAQGFPRHWFAGDPYRSHLFNAISMTFPQGEQFFLECVKAALPLARDAGLREAMEGFVGQEATHRHLHAQYNQELERQGLRYVLKRWIDWRISNAPRVSLASQLAVVAAFEHLTALFARVTLRPESGLAQADAVPRLLWSWHCAEEMEHRSVAFDACQLAGGTHALRVGWMAYACVLFTADMTVQTLCNLKRDRQLWRWRTWSGAARYWLSRHGVLWAMVPHLAAYLSPRFHPSRQADDNDLAAQWLQAHRGDYREVPRRPAATGTAPS